MLQLDIPNCSKQKTRRMLKGGLLPKIPSGEGQLHVFTDLRNSSLDQHPIVLITPLKSQAMAQKAGLEAGAQKQESSQLHGPVGSKMPVSILT